MRDESGRDQQAAAQYQDSRESVIPGVPVGFIVEAIRQIDKALAETDRLEAGEYFLEYLGV